MSAEMFTQHAVFNYDVCVLFDSLVSFEVNDFVLVFLGSLFHLSLNSWNRYKLYYSDLLK